MPSIAGSTRSNSALKKRAEQEVKDRSKRRRLSLPSTIDSSTSVNPEKVLKQRRLSRRLSNPTTQDNENQAPPQQDDPSVSASTRVEKRNETNLKNAGSSSSSKRQRTSLRLTSISNSSSKENQDNDNASMAQGPTPYYKVVEDRGGEMSPRLTRSASKNKKKPKMSDRPPLAGTSANINGKREDGRPLVLFPPNHEQIRQQEQEQRTQEEVEL